ncbi:YjfB family protein [Evansella tamaricis]|uniref:YjfB family protein n=1 Tax=Evansella tamaricis TaxID=2069301 RepID=A0ABS6JH09_9BACI|nr:YjfB family protein [Evansella tamaricis]MBU9711755.1 YjfB family protein [Evansella tamaricis]
MNIPLISMALSQGQIQQQVSIAVMKKALGNQEQQGVALQKLMNSADMAAVEQSVRPHVGGNIDVKI